MNANKSIPDTKSCILRLFFLRTEWTFWIVSISNVYRCRTWSISAIVHVGLLKLFKLGLRTRKEWFASFWDTSFRRLRGFYTLRFYFTKMNKRFFWNIFLIMSRTRRPVYRILLKFSMLFDGQSSLNKNKL